MRLSLFLLVSVLFAGCAPFPKEFKTTHPITSDNLNRLDGEFEVKAFEDSGQNADNISYHNAYRKFYRGFGKMGRDTFETSDLKAFSFSVEVLNDANLKIGYLKNRNLFRTFTLKYKLKDDGYVYLKNRNLKISGIPFLLGGNDIKKLRLGIELNKLVIEEVHHSSGGFLLIFSDFKTWNYRNTYKRLN